MSFRASPCYILLLIQSYVSVGPFSEERERLYSSDKEDWLQMGIDAHQSQYNVNNQSPCAYFGGFYITLDVTISNRFVLL